MSGILFYGVYFFLLFWGFTQPWPANFLVEFGAFIWMFTPIGANIIKAKWLKRRITSFLKSDLTSFLRFIPNTADEILKMGPLRAAKCGGVIMLDRKQPNMAAAIRALSANRMLEQLHANLRWHTPWIFVFRVEVTELEDTDEVVGSVKFVELYRAKFTFDTAGVCRVNFMLTSLGKLFLGKDFSEKAMENLNPHLL